MGGSYDRDERLSSCYRYITNCCTPHFPYHLSKIDNPTEQQRNDCRNDCRIVLIHRIKIYLYDVLYFLFCHRIKERRVFCFVHWEFMDQLSVHQSSPSVKFLIYLLCVAELAFFGSLSFWVFFNFFRIQAHTDYQCNILHFILLSSLTSLNSQNSIMLRLVVTHLTRFPSFIEQV